LKFSHQNRVPPDSGLQQCADVTSKPVDRTVRDVDVIEHVLKGVRTEPSARADASHLQYQSWLGGEVLSQVSVEVVPDEETDDR
jgi:hypothetical protein